MVRELLQGVLDYVRLKMLAVPAGVQTTPLAPDATVAQLAERVNQLTAALDALLKADLIQGTRLLAQEPLLDAPEQGSPMLLSSPMMEEMSSLQRMEYFRPRILPPDPSDETPEGVSTTAGDAGTGEDYSRADHVHYADIPDPSDTAPQDVTTGSGSAGSSDNYSRADHVHHADIPSPSTSDPNPVQRDGDETAGSSAYYSRGDHVHALPLAPTSSQTGPGLEFVSDQGVYKLKIAIDLVEGPFGFDGSSGALIFNAGDGLDLIGGELILTHGSGLKIDNNQLQADIGNGLEFDGNAIAARPGKGLSISGGAIVVKLDSNSSLNYGAEGGLKVAPGSAVDSFSYKDGNGDTKYVHLDANKLILSYGETDPV